MKDKANAISHLKTHQAYPATRDQLVAECDNLYDFSLEDKEWFKANLPEGTYKSAEEVIKVLELK